MDNTVFRTLSRVFRTQSRSQLLCLQQGRSGQRLHEAEASQIRRLNRFEVHVRSEAGSPDTAKETGKSTGKAIEAYKNKERR